MTAPLLTTRTVAEHLNVSAEPHTFALFSGGNDSLCSTHLAMTSGLASEVVHVNTGIGIEQTREFVRETCRRQGWRLNELHPPVSYEDIVKQHGFPGPGAHRYVYIRLKERCLATFAQERGRPIRFVTGVRAAESKRRMGYVKREVVDAKKGWTWYAPIVDFTKRDVGEYLDAYRLPRNDVVALLHMSGECLCGAFARPGEIQEIEQWYPETAARIHALEDEVAALGIHGCIWGHEPPDVHREQMVLDESLMLCRDCA